MVHRDVPPPDPAPRLRLVVPAVPAFAALAGTAAEVLLAGHVDEPGTTVAAVRQAAAAVIGDGSPGRRLELELSRTAVTLTLCVRKPAHRGDPARGTLAALADHLSVSDDRLELTWSLPSQ